MYLYVPIDVISLVGLRQERSIFGWFCGANGNFLIYVYGEKSGFQTAKIESNHEIRNPKDHL